MKLLAGRLNSGQGSSTERKKNEKKKGKKEKKRMTNDFFQFTDTYNYLIKEKNEFHYDNVK